MPAKRARKPGFTRPSFTRVLSSVSMTPTGVWLGMPSIPYRQGLLPSVRIFIDHLAAEFPKAVLI
jgi:hypothetical protein